MYADKIICLDEVQRKPELFTVLRALIDEDRRAGRYLVLGPASPELLRQSAETLAGRIAYHYVYPFNLTEMATAPITDKLYHIALSRGGFPDSFLAPTHELSYHWRENFGDSSRVK